MPLGTPRLCCSVRAVKPSPAAAEDTSVNLNSVLPAVATVAAAALTALGGSGWTADSRLLRRAERELDLAAKTPQRKLRVSLREAAYADINAALQRRGTWRPLIAVGSASLGATVVAFWLIPWWIGKHPGQLLGVTGWVWAALLLTYWVGRSSDGRSSSACCGLGCASRTTRRTPNPSAVAGCGAGPSEGRCVRRRPAATWTASSWSECRGARSSGPRRHPRSLPSCRQAGANLSGNSTRYWRGTCRVFRHGVSGYPTSGVG